MKQPRLLLNLAGVALLGATAFGIGAAVNSSPTLMSVKDYEGLRVAITMDADEERAQCNRLGGARRLACHAEARADLDVHLAELEVKYRGTHEAAQAARKVRIRADFDKARAQCFGLSGYSRDSCIVEAHAGKSRSLVAARTEN